MKVQDPAFFSLMQGLRRVLELHRGKRHGHMLKLQHIRGLLHALLREFECVLQRQPPAQLGPQCRMRLCSQHLQHLRPFKGLLRFGNSGEIRHEDDRWGFSWFPTCLQIRVTKSQKKQKRDFCVEKGG